MKRIFIAISVLSAVVMLMGCTQKVPTPEKIVDKRERVQRMITRVYPDKTVQDVLWAADRVFRLADDNYVISPSPDGLRAERNWKKKEALLTSDFSRATSFGSDTWMVTPKPLPQGGVKVTAMHSMQAAFVSGCLLLPYPNRSDATLCPEMPNLTTTSATYDLFFARLDYLLGKRKDWITCKKAQKLFTNGESSLFYENLDPFCTDANDHTPDSLAVQRGEKEILP